MNKKSIKQFNKKGEPHGYWEIYHLNGRLYCKGNYVNGERKGYWEIHYPLMNRCEEIYYT